MIHIRLNHSDRDPALLSSKSIINQPPPTAHRSLSSTAWVGARADYGVDLNAGGKFAFKIKIEKAGTARVGWSAHNCKTLELGMDKEGLSFGYGATGTLSEKGKYRKFGQSFTKDDELLCVCDADKWVLQFWKNGVKLPGDAFRLDWKLFDGSIFFPHILLKDAVVSIDFGNHNSKLPDQAAKAGVIWLADRSKGISILCESEKKNIEEPEDGANQDNNAQMLASNDYDNMESNTIGNQIAWKKERDCYTQHFRALLSLEHVAEAEQVGNRVKKASKVLERDGYGCGNLRCINFKPGEEIVLGSNTSGVPLPHLSEISIGREVLISEDLDSVEDIDNGSSTIKGEVIGFERCSLIIKTSFTRLPKTSKDLFRIDLGCNIASFERMDRCLDEIQQGEGPSKNQQKKNKFKLGLVFPGTKLADAIFQDVGETAAAAQKWDVRERQQPNVNCEVSKAAREKVDYGSVGLFKLQREGGNKGRYKELDFEDISTKPDYAKTFLESLNSSQKKAVDLVTKYNRKMTFIQGPPGCGKTHAAAAIALSLLKKGVKPLLCTAFSNKGADQLGSKLHRLGAKVVRVGASEVDFGVDALSEKYNCSTDDAIAWGDVIVATCIGSKMGLLKKYNFPTVIIDEAAQIVEPACLLPLSKNCISAVLLGDQ